MIWSHTHLGQSWNFIVSQGGYMELQHLNVLLDDVRGGSVLLVPD